MALSRHSLPLASQRKRSYNLHELPSADDGASACSRARAYGGSGFRVSRLPLHAAQCSVDGVMRFSCLAGSMGGWACRAARKAAERVMTHTGGGLAD